ncbi:MAG: VWA domain-containing protein, partial [Candidatus Binatia bacterium]
GAETKDTTSWRQWLKDSSQASDIQPAKTNLEKLFENLLALPAAPRSLFLFTDGWETQGNLERLLPSIAASGLKVFPIIPADRPNIANVTVAKLMAPSHGDSGEAINMRVVVENHNDREVEGTLTLTRNGEPFKTDHITLKPGSQILSYQTTLSEGSLNSYRASFTPRQADLDRYTPDNQALAWVTVRTKAKILLVNGRNAGRYLEEILRRQGFEVTSRPPESAPAPSGFNVVIFNNVERERVASNYLSALEKHVNAGNGFVMLGSEWSFGPGGYRRTPVETILPVEFKEPKQEEKNRAVVLVIDKSGSMREDNRILYAQEAAKAVARQLKDNDLLGVVGFDVSPFIVVPLAPVGSLRGTFNSQIERLKPGGRTFLLPAIIEAKRQIERQNAGRKHVIILSDGETGGSGGDYIDVVSVMRTEQKITVSSVAIGAEANVPLMKRISQYGGGFFHHTYDPSSLPQIVLQQMQEKTKDDPPPPEKDLTPIQERGSEILASWSGRSYPPVRGFIETELKR